MTTTNPIEKRQEYTELYHDGICEFEEEIHQPKCDELYVSLSSTDNLQSQSSTKNIDSFYDEFLYDFQTQIGELKIENKKLKKRITKYENMFISLVKISTRKSIKNASPCDIIHQDIESQHGSFTDCDNNRRLLYEDHDENDAMLSNHPSIDNNSKRLQFDEEHFDSLRYEVLYSQLITENMVLKQIALKYEILFRIKV
eukprot:514377_1